MQSVACLFLLFCCLDKASPWRVRHTLDGTGHTSSITHIVLTCQLVMLSMFGVIQVVYITALYITDDNSRQLQRPCLVMFLSLVPQIMCARCHCECYRMWCAGYDHPVDTVVNDLVDCLEDLALPLMQFTEAFAVVQVLPLLN